MIDKKLNFLSEFIKKISEDDKIELLQIFISKIEKTDTLDQSRFNTINKELFTTLDTFYDRYEESIVIYDEFLYMIFEYLQQNLQRHMIYKKALDLGIDPNLFKKEMGFLFKGKPLE